MRKTLLMPAACALALEGAAVSQAQQGPAGPMMQDRPGMMQQGGAPSGKAGSPPMECPG